MKQINTKENLFFGDSPKDHLDPATRTPFISVLIDENIHLFSEAKIEFLRERDDDNNFIKHTKYGIFKSQNGARDFFNQMTNSLHPGRLASRAWNQAHEILSKTVIINLTDNTELSILDCLENVCERFGGVCNETNGCATVPFAKAYKNKKQFPINVVRKI